MFIDKLFQHVLNYYSDISQTSKKLFAVVAEKLPEKQRDMNNPRQWLNNRYLIILTYMK